MMTTAERPEPLSRLFTRLFWMLLGPMILAIALIYIINTGQGWLTGADVLFFVVLASVLGARFLEFRRGNAQTATGETLTRAQMQRYLLIASIAGMAAWVLANFVGNHWLAG